MTPITDRIHDKTFVVTRRWRTIVRSPATMVGVRVDVGGNDIDMGFDTVRYPLTVSAYSTWSIDELIGEGRRVRARTRGPAARVAGTRAMERGIDGADARDVL